MANKKVLIIDDHADTRLVVSARLKKHRYDAVCAADAVQALTVARQTQPDVILLDLGLPGVNGFLVLERLKAITTLSAIPVIIMTVDDSPESELRGLEGGAVAVLRKPVQEEALVAAVEYALGSCAGSRSIVRAQF